MAGGVTCRCSSFSCAISLRLSFAASGGRSGALALAFAPPPFFFPPPFFLPAFIEGIPAR